MSIRKGQVIVAGTGNTRRNIGEVYYSQSSLATDNSGALPLWTGESVATAMYPSLTEWVTKHTELQCTAEEYERALTTYGECPKYVLSTDSLRLPRLANYIKMANGIDGITQKEAGLPNITGHLDGNEFTYDGNKVERGALYATNSTFGNHATGSSGGTSLAINLDASRDNAIYGKSDTVTPAHTTLYPWVVAYTASIEASVAQAAEFQHGLSGKVDLAVGVDNSAVDYVVESYNDGANWYRVYKSGWVEQGGRITMTDSTNQTVSFLKTMFDTNYTWNVHGIRTGGNDQYAWQCGVYNEYTTTSMQIRNSSNGAMSICWEVKGQGA